MGKKSKKPKRIECGNCGDMVKPHQMIRHRRALRCSIIGEVKRIRQGLLVQGFHRFDSTLLRSAGVSKLFPSWFSQRPPATPRKPQRVRERWTPHWAILVMTHTAETDPKRALTFAGTTRDRSGALIKRLVYAPVFGDNDLLTSDMALTILRAGQRYPELRHAIAAAASAGARDLMLDIAASIDALDALNDPEGYRFIPDIIRDIGTNHH